jgi:hypothetical protein
MMRDAQILLDQQLSQLGRTVLRDGGSVSTSEAKHFAEVQYEKFDRRRKLERHEAADRQIAELTKEAKALPKTPKGRR